MLDRHDALVTTLLHTQDDWQRQQGYRWPSTSPARRCVCDARV
jgi:hypothetical protein